jgi:hypothetical protein
MRRGSLVVLVTLLDHIHYEIETIVSFTSSPQGGDDKKKRNKVVTKSSTVKSGNTELTAGASCKT